jgi:hypothetical protein
MLETCWEYVGNIFGTCWEHLPYLASWNMFQTRWKHQFPYLLFPILMDFTYFIGSYLSPNEATMSETSVFRGLNMPS